MVTTVTLVQHNHASPQAGSTNSTSHAQNPPHHPLIVADSGGGKINLKHFFDPDALKIYANFP